MGNAGGGHMNSFSQHGASAQLGFQQYHQQYMDPSNNYANN